MPGSIRDLRFATIGGIPYTTMAGYPKFKRDESSLTAEEKYLIRATDVVAFAIEAIPPPVVLGPLVYKPPNRRMPGAPVLVTQDVSFDPHEADLPFDPLLTDTEDVVTYGQYYVATIRYSTQTQDNETHDPARPETFLEQSINVGGEFLSISPAKTKGKDEPVADDPAHVPAAAVENKDPNMGITKILPTIEHSLRWKYALNPDWTEIVAQLGTVNQQPYPYLLNAFSDTVMFAGVSGNRTWSFQDDLGTIISPWNLDFKFSQRSVVDGGFTYGWQHVFRPRDGKWVKLLRANGADLYDQSDFDDLFKAGAPLARV